MSESAGAPVSPKARPAARVGADTLAIEYGAALRHASAPRGHACGAPCRSPPATGREPSIPRGMLYDL